MHLSTQRRQRVGAPGAVAAGGRHRRPSVVIAVAVAGALALSAAAAAGSFTVRSARVRVGSRSEKIAVNASGVAVYELLPETTGHLLCTSGACLSAWPPVRVAAHARLTRGAGVGGRLGTLRRHGFSQLTLGGHPLYTFAGDGGQRGIATGDGLRSFGGTWHVLAEH